MSNVQIEVTAERMSASREQRLLLRIGGVCAIIGTLLFSAALAVHGDLPADQGAVVALSYIANKPGWFPIHLAMILGALLWVGAFAALAGTLAPGAAGAVGRLLVPSAIVGGMFSVFNYAVDGYAFGLLAERWAAASGSSRTSIERIFDAALGIGFGTFVAEPLVLYGLTILLAGLAVAFDGRFPVWLGAIGAIVGGAAFINSCATVARLSLTPDWLVFVVLLPLAGLWLLALGILMVRRAGRFGARAANGANAPSPKQQIG